MTAQKGHGNIYFF